MELAVASLIVVDLDLVVLGVGEIEDANCLLDAVVLRLVAAVNVRGVVVVVLGLELELILVDVIVVFVFIYFFSFFRDLN